MRYHVSLGGAEQPIDVTALPSGGYRVAVGGQEVPADVIDLSASGGGLSILVGHRVVDLVLDPTAGGEGGVGFSAGRARGEGRVESERARAAASVKGAKAAGGGDGLIKSPMPGRVLKVLVAEGDEVHAGQSVVVVEAMKMENEIKATKAGPVKQIFAQAGATVESGAKLLSIG
jgi:biotin carboxyl carrier protein